MKTLLVLFLFLLSLLSCQDTNCSGKDVSEDMEEPVDTTPKATAIFWVDKDKDYQAKKKRRSSFSTHRQGKGRD